MRLEKSVLMKKQFSAYTSIVIPFEFYLTPETHSGQPMRNAFGILLKYVY